MDRLVELTRKKLVVSKVGCATIGVVSFILLTTLGAFVKIPLPFSPVPITFQTLFVLLSGAVLGSGLGLLSQVAYLFLGVVGLPIFAGGVFGFARLFGPTGGYIVGFLVCAWLVGNLVHRRQKSFVNTLIAMVAGSLVIYFLGALQLAVVTGCGIKKAILMGILPFIPGDSVKVIVAAFIYNRGKKRFDAIFY